MFELVRCSRCFPNSMIGDLPQFPGVLCPAPCNRCTAVVCVGECSRLFTCLSTIYKLNTSWRPGVRSFPNQEKNLNGDRQRVLVYHVVMAKRKPKVNESQLDSGGGQIDAVREQIALGIAGAGGLTLAGVALRRSGLSARAFNAVTGKTILVHGSPISGLTSIKPNLSNAAKMQGYTTPEVYGANPTRGKSWVTASDYAQLSGSGVQGKGKGSVYIASAKTKDLINSPNPANLKAVPVFASEKSLTVIKEYPVMQGSKKFNQDLKRLGVKLPKAPKQR